MKTAKAIITIAALAILIWLIGQPRYFGDAFWRVGPIQFDYELRTLTIEIP